MDQRERLILVITLSIAGFLAIIIIICFLIWYIRLRRRQKSKSIKHQTYSSRIHRPQYQRSQKLPSTNVIQNRRKSRKKRPNTNDSVISLSFNPPHLINQNVRNLDQLIASESSVQYDDKQPTTYNLDRCYTNPITEPVYTSSSSIVTPVPRLSPTYQSHSQIQQFNNFHFQSSYELNQTRDESPPNPLRYSPNRRQQNDQSPFDHYRSKASSPYSSNENFSEAISLRTTNCSSATLIHKPSLAPLRDDTAILY